MPIRPIDVRRKEFKSSFRGYDANQVDDFLEGSIRDALVHAEQASNDLRRAAAQEAEGIKQSAQREADFTIREAQSRSHQMLADSSARIERVQDSYDALQEAKRSFANEFRHLLKTYTDIMENMEVASAREIEASLRGRLDTESIAVVREAAQEEARSSEEAMAAAGMAPEPVSEDAHDTLSGLEAVDPADQELEPAMDEQPTEVIRPEGSEPETEEPEGAEPEVEPSTAHDEMDQPVQEPPVSVPEAATEVEREEPSLAEESSSEQSFDRQEGERSDSRIYRASRFLRRRE